MSGNHLKRLTKELDQLGQTAPDCFRLLEPYRDILSELMTETRSLLKTYRQPPDPLVLCHTDLHAGNLLLEPNGRIRIVDWDGARIGRAEADLMMFGAGIGGKLSDPFSLAAFRKGYGPLQVNEELIRLLRYLRIIEDLSLFLARIADPITTESRRNRDIGYVLENFANGNTIDCAKRGLGPWNN